MSVSDPRSDQELIAAANAGDAAAFATIYERYRDWAVRLAYRFTGSRDDALEVMQDAFLYLLRKFPGFRLSARLTTFLYPVVKNLALTRRRKKTPATAASDALLLLPAAEPNDADSTKCDLAAVLATLPDAQREVLLMRFVDGMALAEIAEALEIPVGTVKSRVHHALRTLRDDERTKRYFAP